MRREGPGRAAAMCSAAARAQAPTSPGTWTLLGRVVRIALLGFALMVPSQVQAQEVGIALGTPAPPAEVQDLQGNPLQLGDLMEAGKPTLLEFWAIWCEVCEVLQPEMDRVHARFGNEVNVVAVAVGVAQTLRRVNRHLEDHNPGYPFVWDAQGAAVRAFEAPTTSAVVLLDRNGRVAYTGVGGDQALMAAVERVLAP